jgi:XTP/dITP diphosphohydrolase
VERQVIYIASKNVHKVAEFERMLAPLGWPVRALPDGLPASPEGGSSFAANAMEKASFYGAYCPGWVLADDSGLCVDALNGRPGVWSARYAGVPGDDAANNRKLLAELKSVPMHRRGAEFVCALALWRNDSGTGIVVTGKVRGCILEAPRGSGGFGYDPLFLVPELGRTFAEMSGEEKNRHSHRRAAVDKLLRVLTECTS